MLNDIFLGLIFLMFHFCLSPKRPVCIKIVYFFYISEDSSSFVIGFVGGIVGAITINLITFIFYYSIKYKRNKSDNGKFFRIQ